MTKTKEWIVEYLKGKDYTSPTEIGRVYGNTLKGNPYHNYHSAWASPKCKQLVADGKLIRNSKGHYKLLTEE